MEFQRDGRLQQVRARKEVILSAGAINSPQLLMLSGIGEDTHLRSKGIPVLQNLPGVGRNLMDHIAIGGDLIVVIKLVYIQASIPFRSGANCLRGLFTLELSHSS